MITNTCFQHPKRQRYTWISPQGNIINQIDYILVRKSWFTSILDAKTRPGADCDTDHILTTAKLRLKTFRMPKTSNAPVRYNLDRLGNAQTASEYAVATENRFQVLLDEWDEEASTNNIWNDMETIWKDSADEILGKLRQKRSNAWISNETIHLAADKREARKRGDMTAYKRLRNEIQRLIRRDKNSWLENECKALDQYDRTGKARQLFEKVRKVKKTPFKAKQACINDTQGNIITEQEPALERWREYNEQLFAKPLNEPILDIQDYNVSEPVSLYREVTSAIVHLKRRKAPGVDGIPADLIRASGLNAVEALYRLTVKIWRDCS